ncbi:MAG: hypothetical protein HY047_21440 [Acidobacteria bacterium]|nr:hypothetical protein [Acidobacteriota bacterium]
MRITRSTVTGLIMLFAVSASVFVRAGQQAVGQAPTPFPLSPTIRATGQGVTGAFEGWYYNKDGSVSVLVGYFNRNTKQELDIPIGSNNRIEPGGPDQGQPTHFLTGRQYGVFAIKVPKDFGTKQLTWTLVANGQTNVIPLHLKADWVVEPYLDAGSQNTPPVLRFQPNGPTVTGPPVGIAASYSTTVPDPVTLTTWVTDEAAKVYVEERPQGRGRGSAARGSSGAPIPTPPPLSITWSLLRGPGIVKFENAKPAIDKADGGTATTTATFSAPGEYVLRVQANDQSGEGGGGFQCCWTNAHVSVTVKPTGAATR